MTIHDESLVLDRLSKIDESGAYQHYRPLTEAADEYVVWAETPAARVYTGIRELDEAMRGTAPGELTLIQGFTHSGKTVVATEIMLSNRHRPMVLFTPDETRQLVLTKLTASIHGIGAEGLEMLIQNDHDAGRRVLMETAQEFGKLAVFDDECTIQFMDTAYGEAGDVFGTAPEGVIFDYAGLLAGVDDIKEKITVLKKWGKRHGVPMFVLHQSSRTSGAGGRKVSIDSGEYGGEQQATHVIGVRRKKFAIIQQLVDLEEKLRTTTNGKMADQYAQRISELRAELPQHEYTVTVNLVKNKRPPSRLVDDIDFRLDPETGKFTHAAQGAHDKPAQAPLPSGYDAKAALKARYG